MYRNFLIGSPRSGTTLLQSLLASHSKIVSFPETHLLSKTISIHKVGQFCKIYRPGNFKMLEEQLVHLGLEPERVLLPQKTVFKSSDWVKCILQNIDELAKQMSTNSETHWLEKTPRHLHFAGLITRADPAVKFLHIIRRGEHVVPSLYFATQKYPGEWSGARSIKKCVYWWNRSVKVSSLYLNRPTHIHISYEQMVDQPEKVLNAVFDFLGLNHEKHIIDDYYKTAQSLIEESESWKRKNTNSTITQSDKLDRLDEKVQKYIKDNLIDFPYERILI